MSRAMHSLPALLASLLLLAAPAAAQTRPAPPAPVDAPTAALERANRDVRTPSSTVAVGQAVASAADPRAAEAGAEMLAKGGSAADAAAAMLIALTVVEPQSSGLGGGGFLMHHDASTGRITAIDGRETAPAAARPDRFLDAQGEPRPFREAVWGGLSVGVPGNPALIAAMHARWGKLPWAALFQPAIRLARDGFVSSPRFVRMVGMRREMIAATPVARRFLDAQGQPLPAGTRVVQPELAATLQALAAGGPLAFYRGAMADGIARAVAASPRNPAQLTAADLAAYQVVHRTPRCLPYRGWRICGMGPPSSGATTVLAILAMLERFDLAGLGRDNPLAWHLIAEAERLAYADREAWLADPGFAPVPTDGLLDPAYLAARSQLIRLDRAMPEARPGTPPGAPRRAPTPANTEIAGTSHMVAVDAEGNVANLTSTIESVFGSGLTAGGMFLNNELTDFDFRPVRDGIPAPNRVEPGKRPRSSMSPTLVYAPDGRLHAAMGAAGGPTIIAQVAKTIIAMVDWRLPVEEAIAEPVLYAAPGRFAVEEGTRLVRMIPTLRALGHTDITAARLPTKTNAIARAGDRWRGAADPRSDGQAVAAERVTP